MHAVDSEALEGAGAELLAQALVGGIVCEQPVLKLERKIWLGENLGQLRFEAALNKHFLGCHGGHDLVGVLRVAFGGKKLAGAYVEKGDAYQAALAEMHGGQKVVAVAAQHSVAESHSGRDKFCNATFYKLFGELGIFELFADGNTFAGAHQFWQIAVERMVRKAGELDILRGTVCPACQCYAQDFRCYYGIVAECFVEVAHTEQKNGIRMFLFHLDVLLHQRCFHYFIGHERYVICRISSSRGQGWPERCTVGLQRLPW